MGMLNNLIMRFKWRGAEVTYEEEGQNVSADDYKFYFKNAYDKIEVVNRGVDLLVDSASEVDISFAENSSKLQPRTRPNNSNVERKLRRPTVEKKLQYNPNSVVDINTFRRQLYIDLVTNGNCYQYWDGADLWHLRADRMEVITSENTKIKGYKYDGDIYYEPWEIIHTRENSVESIVVGKSRLVSARNSIRVLFRMLDFQELFFENGAVPGLILTTPNVLGTKIKQKLLQSLLFSY